MFSTNKKLSLMVAWSSSVSISCFKVQSSIGHLVWFFDSGNSIVSGANPWCLCMDKLTSSGEKGLTLVQALRSRVGAKGCWRHFFKNPTTQLRVDWVLTEKKCEQTPKFACFSVQRRPLHLSQAEMLPSHAVLKEGIK